MDRDRNRVDPKQTNTFGISDPDRLGVGRFLFRKRHSFAKDPLLLFHRPFGRKRKKLFQLLEGGLSIHDCLKSKNSAEQTEKTRVSAEIRSLPQQNSEISLPTRGETGVTVRKATKNRCSPHRKARRNRPTGLEESYRRSELRRRNREDCFPYYKEPSLSSRSLSSR